jgi:hypothetical protein
MVYTVIAVERYCVEVMINCPGQPLLENTSIC